MKVFEAGIEINAPIDVVWNILTDYRTYPDWNPFVIRAEGAMAEGEQVKFRVANQPIDFEATIVSLIPQQEFIWESQPIPGLKPRYIRQLTQLDANRTHFYHRDEFSGWLVTLIAPILSMQFSPFYEATCEALKNYAEVRVRQTVLS